MTIPCEIIRDLLPLYHDGVCSDGSKSMVEEHLKTCEACRRELQLIDTNLCVEHISPQKEKSMQAISSAWKKVKKKAFVKGALIAVGIITGLILAFNLCFSIQLMEGPSMQPEIYSDDICLVSKLSYRFDEPKPGDVISARIMIGNLTLDDIVRVIAVPGDTVKIEGGTLYVNGETSGFFPEGEVNPYDMDTEIVVGKDCYFVMGDNQSITVDSRDKRYGLVSADDLNGKVIKTFNHKIFLSYEQIEATQK